MHSILYRIILLGISFGLITASPARRRILPRDNATVVPVINAVSAVTSSLVTLDTNINTLSVGNLISLTNLVINLKAVEQTLAAATSSAQALPGVLDINDSNLVGDQIKPLIKTFQSTISDLGSKQSVIASAGLANTTLAVLVQQKTASLSFANALQVKSPVLIQQLTMELVSNVSATFDGAIKSFDAAAAAGPSLPALPILAVSRVLF
ncbi:hypothetical protein GQ53DRAFT_827441 [Thozetella sp. PMI_491]|nr:hypothetical protein GQ53DRAFT_827441 [Thozetella sp. PMI_491]